MSEAHNLHCALLANRLGRATHANGSASVSHHPTFQLIHSGLKLFTPSN